MLWSLFDTSDAHRTGGHECIRADEPADGRWEPNQDFGPRLGRRNWKIGSNTLFLGTRREKFERRSLPQKTECHELEQENEKPRKELSRLGKKNGNHP